MARELTIDVVVNNTEGVAKLRETDVAIDQVGATAAQTSTTIDRGAQGFDTYTVSAKEAADVLSGNVTPGINDLAEAAGITYSQLGLLNSAGLAIGVGYAAWGIGRAVADFFDLDDTIAKTTASLMGWGNVAAETAGAKADALARATQIAGREITDMGEALEINGRQVTEWNATVARAHAPEEARLQIVRWRNEIEVLASAGVLQSFTADLQANDLSIKFLAEHYGISTGAIALYKKELKEGEADQKRWTAAQHESTGAAKAHNAEMDRLTEKLHAIENGGDHAYSTLHQWFGELQRDQKYLNELADQHMQKLMQEAAANDRFLQTELANAQAIDRETQAWLAAAKAADDTAAARDKAARAAEANRQFTLPTNNMFPTSQSLDDAIGPARPSADIRFNLPGARLPIQGLRRATGGGVEEGVPHWVGEQGPEWFTPRTAGAISATGAQAGGAGGISITIMGNVNSEATARLLANQVAEKVMQKLNRGSRRTFSKA